MIRGPRRSTLFPYTPLFRSGGGRRQVAVGGATVHRGDRGAATDGSEIDGGRQGDEGADQDQGGRAAGRVDPPERPGAADPEGDRKSTRLNSSHSQIPDAVFC